MGYVEKLEERLEKYENMIIGINRVKFAILESEKEVFTKEDIAFGIDKIWNKHWKVREEIMEELMEIDRQEAEGETEHG